MFDPNLIDLIKSKLQEIVDKAHADHRKRKIIKYKDKMQVACVYCLDSNKNVHKYRGNLNSALFYKCFNCDKQTHFIQMCKDFKVDIAIDKRIEINNYINDNLTKRDQFQEEYVNANLNALIDLNQLNVYLNSGDSNITNFQPVQSGSVVERYLISRGLYNGNLTNIYQAVYWKNSDIKEPVICLLNRRGDKVLGMQIRNIKEGKARFFKICNFEAIHKWLNTEDKWLDDNDYYSYNRLSLYFNILSVDFDRPITIFEGYLDSLFYPNSIGVVGVNTPTDFIEANGVDIKYFFDNDEAGWVKSEEKIKNGFSVFLWNKLIEDVIRKKNSDDPFKMKLRLDKIKDLNKLATIVKHPYEALKLDTYFSKDIFDLAFIPKTKKKKFFKKSY